MSGMGYLILIDAGFAGQPPQVVRDRVDSVYPLVEPQGEYCQAIAGLRRHGVASAIPPEVALHELAYELLERVRERQAHRGVLGRELLVLPFWPEALFAAAGIDVHACREIEALFPAVAETWHVSRTRDETAATAAHVLLPYPFDPEAYARAMSAAAARRGWLSESVYRPSPGWPKGRLVPDRCTAGAWIERDGRVLLERRPGNAKVSPGLLDTPGGHLRPSELPGDALVRELREELGIALTGYRLASVYDEYLAASDLCYRHFEYIAEHWQGEPTAREGQDLAWFPNTTTPRRR